MPLEPEGICFGVLTILLSEIRWVEAFMRPTQAVETITSLVTSRKLPIFDVKMKKPMIAVLTGNVVVIKCLLFEWRRIIRDGQRIHHHHLERVTNCY